MLGRALQIRNAVACVFDSACSLTKHHSLASARIHSQNAPHRLPEHTLLEQPELCFGILGGSAGVFWWCKLAFPLEFWMPGGPARGVDGSARGSGWRYRRVCESSVIFQLAFFLWYRLALPLVFCSWFLVVLLVVLVVLLVFFGQPKKSGGNGNYFHVFAVL